jgi:hypothetical protein
MSFSASCADSDLTSLTTGFSTSIRGTLPHNQPPLTVVPDPGAPGLDWLRPIVGILNLIVAQTRDSEDLAGSERQIEPATGPPGSELLAEPDLPISPSSHSLWDLLEKIYQGYASTPVLLLRLTCMVF